MSESEPNLKEYLSTFNHIVSLGTKHEKSYHLLGVDAWHDFDGYTCFIGYKDLTLTLLFHGRYSFDYDKKETLNEFLALVPKINQGNKDD